MFLCSHRFASLTWKKTTTLRISSYLSTTTATTLKQVDYNETNLAFFVLKDFHQNSFYLAKPQKILSTHATISRYFVVLLTFYSCCFCCLIL